MVCVFVSPWYKLHKSISLLSLHNNMKNVAPFLAWRRQRQGIFSSMKLYQISGKNLKQKLNSKTYVTLSLPLYWSSQVKIWNKIFVKLWTIDIYGVCILLTTQSSGIVKVLNWNLLCSHILFSLVSRQTQQFKTT